MNGFREPKYHSSNPERMSGDATKMTRNKLAKFIISTAVSGKGGG